ncbi:hypothetical protein PGT21_014562 [Puccinia graminis f. sp. tritici]|uniref:AMP-dependent synthetase/ligase domain-containing protein n=1 Tax=Puccinia graminis f. sp. tritici TaxID=56615 RepID=A0A5B0MM16_PUCGR|nr:hypothetical protein PGT21_014562 [Puccinia graminis f. sp. tritici]
MEDQAVLIGFDQLTSTLIVLFILSYLIPSIINPDQSWLIHPIILAHQARFSPTRKQSETPIITNSGATPHSLPVTPDRSVKSLYDLLLKAEGKLQQIDLHSILPQDVRLNRLITNVRNQLWSQLPSKKNEEHPKILILCEDPYLKLVFTLSAATLPITTIVGSSKPTGTISIDSKAALEPYLDSLSLVISDSSSKDLVQELLGPKLAGDCLVLSTAELDCNAWFLADDQRGDSAPHDPALVSQARLRIIHQQQRSSSSTCSNDSTKKEGEGVEVYEYTPENILAGITGSLGIFPVTGKMTSKDRIFLEFNNSDGDDDLWGSEISVALAGLYSGADVYFFNGFKLLSEYKPTILMIKAMNAQILAEEIIQLSNLSLLKKFTIGRRLSQVYNGNLGSPLVETGEWVGPQLRAILTKDPISQSTATLIRAGFGVSMQRIYAHPISTGPILVSQQYDFQVPQSTTRATKSMMGCGPPAANVECKIVGVAEPSLVNHDAWKGKLVVRGPSIGTRIVPSRDPTSQQEDCFFPVAEIAQVLPNGTFLLFPPSSTGDD